MSFSTISSVKDLVKNMALELKWERRKKDPDMKKSGMQSEIERLQEQAEAHRKSMSILAIENKLKSGQKLTSAELDYIKENAPDLYEKAVQIASEREEYRRKLERCKTKEDVRELNTQKLMQFNAEAKSVMRSNMPKAEKRAALEYIGMRMAAIVNEHVDFVKTPEYKSLPDKREPEDDSEERIKNAGDKAPSDEEFWRVKPEKSDDLKPGIKKGGQKDGALGAAEIKGGGDPVSIEDESIPGFDSLFAGISPYLTGGARAPGSRTYTPEGRTAYSHSPGRISVDI